MIGLVVAAYMFALGVIAVTGKLWVFLLVTGLFAGIMLAAARAQAAHDPRDNSAEDFGGSFRGHLPGASDE